MRYLTCAPSLAGLVERGQNEISVISFPGESTAHNWKPEALGVGFHCSSVDKGASGRVTKI